MNRDGQSPMYRLSARRRVGCGHAWPVRVSPPLIDGPVQNSPTLGLSQDIEAATLLEFRFSNIKYFAQYHQTRLGYEFP